MSKERNKIKKLIKEYNRRIQFLKSDEGDNTDMITVYRIVIRELFETLKK
jgi:hypothetical protein